MDIGEEALRAVISTIPAAIAGALTGYWAGRRGRRQSEADRKRDQLVEAILHTELQARQNVLEAYYHAIGDRDSERRIRSQLEERPYPRNDFIYLGPDEGPYEDGFARLWTMTAETDRKRALDLRYELEKMVYDRCLAQRNLAEAHKPLERSTS